MEKIEFARLRAAVALLGADAGAGWWRGRALDGVGRAALARLFPTAPILAALGAATGAASRAHDERIGQSGVYHAFRLPTATEADLAAALADRPDVLAPVVQSPDAARHALWEIADGTSGDAFDGPKSVGDEEAIARPDSVRLLAALYANALESGRPVYPYFTTMAAPPA